MFLLKLVYLLPTSKMCANPSCIKTTARSALAEGSEIIRRMNHNPSGVAILTYMHFQLKLSKSHIKQQTRSLMEGLQCQ